MDIFELINIPLRFSTNNKVLSDDLILSSDGTIQGYDHSNERYWNFNEDKINFLNSNNEVTTEFSVKNTYINSQYINSYKGVYLETGHNHFLTLIKENASVYEILLEQLLCNQSPYIYKQKNVIVDKGYPHTNIKEDFILAILNTIRPKFWLEIGSMIGGSAIKVGNIIKDKKLPTEIVCIDPFTGDVNMWDWERELNLKNQWKFLNIHNGQPTIYERFLDNVKFSNKDDIILPLRMTSIVGMKLLARLYIQGRLNILPQVIYLDSAHEPQETFLELGVAWSILESKGILCGDDWEWDSVRNDVEKFSQMIETDSQKEDYFYSNGFKKHNNILLKDGQWLICKK